MHVITRKRLVEFGQAYPTAVTPLDVCYRLMKQGHFTSPEGLKAVFASVDFLGKGLAVFNIGGKKCRLVATVRYATATNIGRVWVRRIFTHVEYDRWSQERRTDRARIVEAARHGGLPM
jgi:mRNA interferase HigB